MAKRYSCHRFCSYCCVFFVVFVCLLACFVCLGFFLFCLLLLFGEIEYGRSMTVWN